MSEEAGSNDPQVDDMENTADELAHHGDKLQDDIENTRDDWESKKESQAVPGAVPDPERGSAGDTATTTRTGTTTRTRTSDEDG